MNAHLILETINLEWQQSGTGTKAGIIQGYGFITQGQ